MVKRSRQDSISSAADPTLPSAEDVTSRSPSPSVASADPPTHSSKYTQLDPGGNNEGEAVMRCSLAPHRQPLSFPSYEAFEIHYAKSHLNRCSECRKNFPTDHFLGLHIGENHDPLNEARKARGEKTYGCFVEDCDRLCSTPQKRRRHLIDKHMFPKEYDFFVVNDGIDKRSSMLRPRGHRRRSSAAQSEFRARRRNSTLTEQKPSAERTSIAEITADTGNVSGGTSPSTEPPPKAPVDETTARSKPDADMSELTSSMSALKFVPSSVRFGHGNRGGFSTR
ncbi:MAG: hypothetical protein M1833_000072 [Piccolia ochrophora]|nr:MAG: hypothetical protein M1833_000072 [Piccolia ochrophora]